MAVTTQKSTHLTNLDADPVVYDHAVNIRGKLRMVQWDFTQSGAGDANSTIDLIKLPPGRVRVFMDKSQLYNAALGTGRTLDVGWTAYEDIEGDTIAADADGLIDGADVAAAGLASDTELRTGNGLDELDSILFESKEGVTIQAIVLGGTIPDTTVLKGQFCIAQE